MLYYQALTTLDHPATAEEVRAAALKLSPLKVGNIQTVRAALAYMVKTNRATRTSHGHYKAVKTNEDEVLRLVAENRDLREKLKAFQRVFMITIEANGLSPKDFESKSP